MMFTVLQLHDIWEAELKRVTDNRRRGAISIPKPSVSDPKVRDKTMLNYETTLIRTTGVETQPKPLLQEVTKKPNLDNIRSEKKSSKRHFLSSDDDLDELKDLEENFDEHLPMFKKPKTANHQSNRPFDTESYSKLTMPNESDNAISSPIKSKFDQNCLKDMFDSFFYDDCPTTSTQINKIEVSKEDETLFHETRKKQKATEFESPVFQVDPECLSKTKDPVLRPKEQLGSFQSVSKCQDKNYSTSISVKTLSKLSAFAAPPREKSKDAKLSFPGASSLDVKELNSDGKGNSIFDTLDNDLDEIAETSNLISLGGKLVTGQDPDKVNQTNPKTSGRSSEKLASSFATNVAEKKSIIAALFSNPEDGNLDDLDSDF